jgi:hypothetical protein
MNLVNPGALLLAGLAVPIIIFYILKIRLRRVPVSTLLFWQQIFDEKKPRSLWQKLRHLISLLLQLAFLCLLVLALADPIFRWQQARARRIVVVVDNSASMNAHDVMPSRLDAAKAEGQKLIDGMRLGDELAIIAAGTQPRVACGPTDHQRSLRSALDSITPADGPTRMSEAVALARRLLSGSEKARKVVVVSDGGFDKAGELAREADVELVAVGKHTGNVGITRLQARRSLLDPIGYEILVEVENASDEAASFRLELDLEDEPIDVVPLNLAAGERSVQVFEKTSADGGRLKASIDRADAFLADNTAWAILPRRARQKVRLVTPGNLFLEKVFEAIPLVDLEVERVAKEARVPSAPAQASGANAQITVYHRKFPDVLPPGDVLVIEPDRSGPLWQLGEAIHNPVVAKQDKDSPLMLHIRLDDVVMPEARKLSLKAPARVLAESAAGDPLYAVLDRPGAGKLVLLTVDLDKSDLPLQTAFPIMVTNLLSWFGGTKGELREALAAGSVASVELPAEGGPAGEPNSQPGSAGASPSRTEPRRPSGTPGRLEWVLVSPDGKEQPISVPPRTTKATLGPLDRCGVWTVLARAPTIPGSRPSLEKPSRQRDVVLELACNLADRRESDLRPAQGLPELPTSLAAGLAIRPIWYYLLVTALMLTCWEWFLYQRRWID